MGCGSSAGTAGAACSSAGPALRGSNGGQSCEWRESKTVAGTLSNTDQAKGPTEALLRSHSLHHHPPSQQPHPPEEGAQCGHWEVGEQYRGVLVLTQQRATHQQFGVTRLEHELQGR